MITARRTAGILCLLNKFDISMGICLWVLQVNRPLIPLDSTLYSSAAFCPLSLLCSSLFTPSGKRIFSKKQDMFVWFSQHCILDCFDISIYKVLWCIVGVALLTYSQVCCGCPYSIHTVLDLGHTNPFPSQKVYLVKRREGLRTDRSTRGHAEILRSHCDAATQKLEKKNFLYKPGDLRCWSPETELAGGQASIAWSCTTSQLCIRYFTILIPSPHGPAMASNANILLSSIR